MTLVDANVLLALVTDDAHWAEWSIAQLEAASLRGPLLINDIIYVEISIRYGRIEGVEGVYPSGRSGDRSDAASDAVPGREGFHPVSQIGRIAVGCCRTSSSVPMPPSAGCRC